MLINRSFGEFVLLDKIGTGGMAEIFLARRRNATPPKGLVALKIIMPGFAQDDAFNRLFDAEARVTSQFDHPQVIKLEDYAPREGVACMVLEYIHGHTLQELLDARADNKLPIEVALWLTMRACEGMDHVHNHTTAERQRLSIIHRDISPHNIMVTYDGQVKIFDFGIAASALDDDQLESGSMAGKVSYMSPEQCRGEALDPRSDVFAMGVVLWEMTTGRRLFNQGNNIQVINALASPEPVQRPSQVIPDYPPALEAIVMRALAKKRDERTRSALALRMEINQYLQANNIFPQRQQVADVMRSVFANDLERFDAMMNQAQSALLPTLSAATRALNRNNDPASAANIDEDEIESAIELALAAEQAREAARDSESILDNLDALPTPASIHSGSMNALGRPGPTVPMAPPHTNPGIPSPHTNPGMQAYHTNPGAVMPVTVGESSGGTRTALVATIVLLGAALLGLAGFGAWHFLGKDNAATTPPPAKAPPTSGKLMVTTNPAGANITLNGRRLSVTTPATIPDLSFKDPVVITVEKDGYIAVQHKLAFNADMAEQTIQETLNRKSRKSKGTGGLRIVTNPAEATIYLNGQKIADQTPVLYKQVAAGLENALRISRDGFQDEVMAFTVERGEIKDFDVELSQVQEDPMGQLSLTSEPSGCRVTVNGDFYGNTAMINLMVPAEVPLQIQVACVNLDPWERRVVLQPDQELKLHAALGLAAAVARVDEATPDKTPQETQPPSADPQPPTTDDGPGQAPSAPQDPPDTMATVAVNTTPPTTVLANGKPLGQTPVADARLKPGRYTMLFTDKSQNITYAQRIKLEAGQNQTLDVTIPSGTVTIQSDIAANVTINGQGAGATPLTDHTLYAGLHKIRVYAPELGYAREYRIRIRGKDSRAIFTRFKEVKVTRVAQNPPKPDSNKEPAPSADPNTEPGADNAEPDTDNAQEPPKDPEEGAADPENAGDNPSPDNNAPGTEPKDPGKANNDTQSPAPGKADQNNAGAKKKPGAGPAQKPPQKKKPNPLDDEPYPLLK